MANPAAKIREAIQQLWPGATVIGRTRAGLLHAHPTDPNRFSLDVGIGPLHVANTETEISTDWQPSVGAWQYEMLAADFHAFSRDTLGVGTMYRYQDPASGEFVEFQPLALNWVNSANDSRQQITQPVSTPAQVIDGDTLRFPHGYGPGVHFEYQAQTARLRKLVTIDAPTDLPAPTVANPNLEIEFIISKSAGVTEWINGAEWNRTTTTNTVNRVEYRTSTGVVLWVLDYPRAFDSAGNETIGTMQFRRQGANRFVTVRVPKTWLDTAVYPVFLDPTIDNQVANGNADAHENANNGNFDVAAVNIDLASSATIGSRWNGGFYFPSIAIASGSTIDVAYLRWRPQNTTNDDPNVDIHAEAADSPGDFNANADVTDRARSTASVAHVATAVGSSLYNTPDISAVIQGQINRGGWASGNNIVILVIARSDSSSAFRIRSYEQTTTDCATLHIEYTAGGGESHSGTATITGNGTLTATGAKGASSSVTISGNGALAATGTKAVEGTATITGNGAVTATGTKQASGAATISGNGTVSATATTARAGSAAISGNGTLTASGTGATAASGTASISGNGTLSATGQKAASGSASISGNGTLTASGTKAASGTASISGNGALVVAAAKAASGSAAISGNGALAATASTQRAGTAALSGNGTLTATGEGSTAGAGSASISGGGILTATGQSARSGTASVSGNGALSATGTKQASGTASISGNGSLSASGTQSETHSGTATVTGNGTLAALGTKQAFSIAAITGDGSVIGSGTSGRLGSATITGNGLLTQTQTTARFGTALISGGGTLTATLATILPDPTLVSPFTAITISGRTRTTSTSGRTKAEVS